MGCVAYGCVGACPGKVLTHVDIAFPTAVDPVRLPDQELSLPDGKLIENADEARNCRAKV